MRVEDNGQVEPTSSLFYPRGEAADVGLEFLGDGVDLVGRALPRVSKFLGRRKQFRGVRVGVLGDVLKVLVTLLINAGFLQVSTDPRVLANENLAVVRQPVENLLDVFLKQSEKDIKIVKIMNLKNLIISSIQTSKNFNIKTLRISPGGTLYIHRLLKFQYRLPQRESLMQLDLAGVPPRLECPMMAKYLVYDREHVRRPLAVVRGWISAESASSVHVSVLTLNTQVNI